jgi:ATP-binding cassette subfamily F protein 3
MLRVQRVTKSFGARAILREASLEIRPGERVGLVGANGAGKSTLVDLIRSVSQPDSGSIDTAGWVMGHLAQDTGLDPAWTVRDAMWDVFRALTDVHAQLARVEAALHLAGQEQLEPLIHEQAALLEDFDRLNGHTADSEIASVLAGLGFSPRDGDRLVGTFSGGWQVRIALGRLLLGTADLLLLDEPTNHLDADAVDWLHGFLNAKGRAALVVSHDRYFLDKATTRTVELENAVLTSYAGSYLAYAAEKGRRVEAQQAAAERQQEYLADQRALLDRFRAKATKAAMVQSREKQLAKIERIEAPKSTARLRLTFPKTVEPGREIVRARAISHGYGGKLVLGDVELRVGRGDKVGIVGPNGAGKSTLLRLLAMEEQPDAGFVSHGTNVLPGYFPQNAAEGLDPRMTVIEAVTAVAPPEFGETQIRSILGRFLFKGDDVFKRIRVLSGGERNRVALARLLARPLNTLLLDEPTNHLDIPGREALEEALADYPGTMILVTHDRYLLRRVATRIVEVRDASARVFDGDYAFYERKASGREPEPVARSAAAHEDARQPAKDAARRERRQRASVLRTAAMVEAEIDEIEDERAQAEAALSDPDVYGSAALAEEAAERLHAIERRLEALLAEWELLAEAEL